MSRFCFCWGIRVVGLSACADIRCPLRPWTLTDRSRKLLTNRPRCPCLRRSVSTMRTETRIDSASYTQWMCRNLTEEIGDIISPRCLASNSTLRPSFSVALS